jgi:protease I
MFIVEIPIGSPNDDGGRFGNWPPIAICTVLEIWQDEKPVRQHKENKDDTHIDHSGRFYQQRPAAVFLLSHEGRRLRRNHRSAREEALEYRIDMREEGWDLDTERRGYSFESDMTFAEVDPTTFDALILPGWRAIEYLRNNERCVDIVRHFVEANKPIAAIDQAPRLLIAAGVRGRRMTGIEMIKIEIARANTYVDAGSEPVVDRNILTVSRRPYYDVWMREFMSMLKERRLAGV